MKGYEIKRIVGRYYNVDMDTKCREREFIRPRQVAQYLCRKKTTLSFMQIANLFNGKDHSTIIHNARLIRELRQQSPELDGEIEDILKIIENMQN